MHIFHVWIVCRTLARCSYACVQSEPITAFILKNLLNTNPQICSLECLYPTTVLQYTVSKSIMQSALYLDLETLVHMEYKVKCTWFSELVQNYVHL